MGPRVKGGPTDPPGESLEERPPRRDAEREPEQPEDLLAEWRSSFEGDGFNIRVERWSELERRWAFLETFPFDGWDPAVLRKWVLGAQAKFRLTLLDNEKRYQKGGRFEMLVANPDWRDTPPAAAAPAAVEKDRESNKLIELLVEQQRAAQAQVVELMKTIAGRPAGPDPLDMFLKLRQLMPEQKQPSMKEMVETMNALRELAGDGGGGEPSWISEIGEGVDLFQKVVEVAAKRRASRAAPAPAQRPAVPAPVGAPVIENPPPQQETMSNPIVARIKPYLAILVGKAERKESVDDAATLLVAAIDNDVMPAVLATYPITEGIAYDQLLSGAKDPAKLEQIYAFAPELTPHREWVAQVISKAIEIYETDDQAAA